MSRQIDQMEQKEITKKNRRLKTFLKLTFVNILLYTFKNYK